MPVTRNIIVVAGDPGGANNLLPVLESLKCNPSNIIKVFAYNQAVDIYSQQKFEVYDLNLIIKDEFSIEGLIKQWSADILLMATSANEFNWERKILKVANQYAIKSIVLLDFWNNYRMRFEDAGGELILPSLLAVMDEQVKSVMVEQGFDGNKITIVGHPGYEKICEEYSVLENSIERDAKQINIMFVSQPIALFYSKLQADKLYLGFNESSVFQDILKICEQLLSSQNINIELNVLLHPRMEDEIDLSAITKPENLLIRPVENTQRYSILKDMQIVIGMYSSFLLEANLLGANTISYQPDKRAVAYEDSPLSKVTTLNNYNDFLSFMKNWNNKTYAQPVDDFSGSIKKVVDLCD